MKEYEHKPVKVFLPENQLQSVSSQGPFFLIAMAGRCQRTLLGQHEKGHSRDCRNDPVYVVSIPSIPDQFTRKGVRIIAISMPTYIASVPSPEAVALSLSGNHRAATLVMAFSMNGCPDGNTDL